MTDAANGGPVIDRRRFLRLAALGAGSLAAVPLLEACARGVLEPVPTPFTAVAKTLHSKPDLQVFPGGGEFLASRSQRMSFGLADKAGASILGPAARFWIGEGSSARGPFPATLRRYGHVVQAGDPTGFYDGDAPMPSNGIAWLMVEAHGLHGFAAFQVTASPSTPAPGQRAIAVATPTVGNARGVANICTRKPQCGLHTVRLDEALTMHKPIVFVIASPLLCTSRTCGPVLDEVIDLTTLPQNGTIFIHAEPYKGDTAAALSPTAQAWRIPSEPWVWLIGSDGVVRARFEGPVVAAEIQQAAAGL